MPRRVTEIRYFMTGRYEADTDVLGSPASTWPMGPGRFSHHGDHPLRVLTLKWTTVFWPDNIDYITYSQTVKQVRRVLHLETG